MTEVRLSLESLRVSAGGSWKVMKISSLGDFQLFSRIGCKQRRKMIYAKDDWRSVSALELITRRSLVPTLALHRLAS
jgi:hypothetical protein